MRRYFLLATLFIAQSSTAPLQKGLAPRHDFPPLTVNKQGAAIGKHRPLPASALNKGRWTKLAGGRRLWRLGIRSPKAVGIRVHFARFAAGKGKVSLSGGGETFGPYTATGIDETGSFWSDTIFADTVTVEYESPPNSPPAARPPFQIVEITHLFR